MNTYDPSAYIAIHASQSLKETPAQTWNRDRVTELIQYSIANESTTPITHWIDKDRWLELTRGQIIKLRNLNSRVCQYDSSREQWFYWDVDKDFNIFKVLLHEEEMPV